MELERPSTTWHALPDRRVLAVAVLALACLAIGTFLAPADSGDFWFFRDRAHDWFGASGWHLHVDHPKTQSGPLSLLLVAAIASVDRTGITVVPLVNALLCGVALASVLRLPGVGRVASSRILVGGLALVAWWWYLARFGHLDDALVLTAALAATTLTLRDRRVAPAVLIGLAIAAKPWAVFLVPITLTAGTPWRRALRAPAMSVLVGGLWWAPFVAFAPGTLGAMQPTVPVAPDSVLRLVGVAAWSTAPAGLRTLQLLLATAVVARLARRGRPELGLLAGVAVRLLLDPATWEYYTVGLVAGALVADLARRPTPGARGRIPWLTLLSATLVVPGSWVDPGVRAVLRSIACIVVLAVVTRTSRSSATVEEPMNEHVLARHDRADEHPRPLGHPGAARPLDGGARVGDPLRA